MEKTMHGVNLPSSLIQDPEGDEYTEVEVGQGIILPSQTRNPAFGIYPWLFDEQSVERVPVFANRTVNFLRQTGDPELSKMYRAFHNMAFYLVYTGGRHYTNLNPKSSSESLLKRLNDSIRTGKFKLETDQILEVSQPTLQRFLHPTTYQAVQEYVARNSARAGD